jgi:tetratricopeptide (TPR) repeat protein
MIASFLAISLTTGGSGRADDSVKTLKDSISGRIVAISPLKIDIEQNGEAKPAAEAAGGKAIKEVPVNEIVLVSFDNEPEDMISAKNQAVAGRYAEALPVLERLKNDKNAAVSRDEIKQELEYYTALCGARLALAGAAPIAEAGRTMKAFLDGNPKSWHALEGAEVLGYLLAGVRQYPQAAEYFARLDKAPWPDYKMRAGIANGRALLAQGKNDEAMKAFDIVLAIDAAGDLAEAQRTWANLGRASVLAASQKTDEAIRIVENIILNASPENEILQARAYNVLGTAYRQANRTNEALLAFLHVDLLYPTVMDAHAEALGNLVELWGQVHRAERAQRAKKTLEEQYKESPWAKKGGG